MGVVIELIELFLQGSYLFVFLVQSRVDIFESEFVLFELVGQLFIDEFIFLFGLVHDGGIVLVLVLQ